MSFANPTALLLVLLIPYFMWVGRPQLAYRRQRDVVSLTLRLIIILFLIGSLAGAQITRAAEKLTVIFLIDASDSVDPAARQQADNYVKQSLAAMTLEDRAGLIVFGQNALVERPISSAKEFAGLTSTPIRLNSNLSEAIRLALAMFPADSGRRIVLLSDGVETRGNAIQAAELAAASGVQIEVVPLRNAGFGGNEILVTDVRAPAKVNAKEQFDLGVTVRSQSATSASLTILASGEVIAQQNVQLKAGVNNFVFTLAVAAQGFSDFRVRVDPFVKDAFYQNNELSGFSEVTGPPRVLIVTPDPAETAALVPALQSAGITVEVITPEAIPGGLAGIAGYQAVVLANVSATRLNTQRMKILQTYVRDLGGGLIVIGGPQSFGAGGYYQTPLEETLPVEMRIRDNKRLPKLTMVYVIDRSGSMEFIGPSGVTNLELAKEAARRSINFLFPQDRAGVLSFDSNPEWLVPIQPVTSRDAMQMMIGTLRPGGGTDINAAVKEIAKALPGDPSSLKHVILLTDGGAEPADSVEIVRRLNSEHGITVTSIGIGDGVPRFMEDISKVGKGIYYNLSDAGNIPQVFAAETVLATRSYLVENPFSVIQNGYSSILNGIEGLPQLLGYIAATPKDTASVILTAPGHNDPILASWQYGLGKAVAFTSDASGRWGKQWTGWAGYSRFWAQLVRSTIVEGVNNRIETRVETRNGQQFLVVDARNDQGSYLNGLKLTAAVVDPKLGGQQITLDQVAPGRYEAAFTPGQEGSYFIRVGGGVEGVAGATVGQTLGWVLSYSPEYQLRETNTNLLVTVARITGGSVLLERPEAAFERNLKQQNASTPIWPYLLLITLLLLPLDIGIRRLVVTRSDWVKLGAWLRERLGIREQVAATAGATVQSERISQLMNVKERVKTSQELGSISTPDLPRMDAPAPKASLTASDSPRPVTPTAKPDSPAPVENKSTPPGTTGSSLASRLVEKKKKG
jgi:uncharacterized membrane protein